MRLHAGFDDVCTYASIKHFISMHRLSFSDTGSSNLPSGKIDAHVTTPAMPPQSKTVEGDSSIDDVDGEVGLDGANARLQSS